MTFHRVHVYSVNDQLLAARYTQATRITDEGAPAMIRERALRIGLVFVGVLFLASGYPLVLFVREDPALSMMFSLYVTLGIFLLTAVRKPSAHRSLIAFTAWSSLAHAAVMGFQSQWSSKQNRL